tara:strand:- start:33957 stop:34496 length:540 start_codon:yes stop_codon:yes gene_type:complete
MITNVISSISSKVQDSSSVFPTVKIGTAVIIDSKEITDPVKRKNYDSLVKLVNDSKHKRMCIIIFAHWCPHCHKLINELAEKADSIKGNGIKYVLVNGDSVHSDAFQGDKAIINLQHYPTILCKVGNVGKVITSLDAVEETCKTMEKDSATTNVIDNNVADTNEKEEEKEEEDILKMLF